MKSPQHLPKLTFACILMSVGAVAQAEPPTDPLFQENEESREYQWGLHALNFPQAWDYTHGHAYLAVLDTGIAISHPDLQANFRPHLSYDFYNDRGDVDELTPDDDTNIANDLVGHGTHVAGILAATANNGVGGVGICWHCSLMVGKISVPKYESITVLNQPVLWSGYRPTMDPSAFADALNAAVDSGAQVVNMSLGGSPTNCGSELTHPLCQAIDHAVQMDVILVGAVGNVRNKEIDFPASNYKVIAAHAVDESLRTTNFTPGASSLELGAPGLNVLSSFYPGIDYIPAEAEPATGYIIKCRESLSGPPDYGPCNGSSMATPYIAGLAALLRSANPLLKREEIRSLMTVHASHPANASDLRGPGVPDAAESVKAAMGVVSGQTLVNRLTPLFTLWNPKAEDHFYTTVPQMAMAAMYETLFPQPPSALVKWVGSREGGRSSKVPGYDDFPRFKWTWWDEKPYAQVYVFTTHRTPPGIDSNMLPLYRISYQGNNNGTNALNLNHIYTTSQAEVANYEKRDVGYKLDGIEGYIFQNHVEGTVRLYKRYNQSRDDHAIFPETVLTWMEAQGYTIQDGIETLGYVYLNKDSDRDGLIDGFEEIIGTSSSNPDSDNDGIKDGIEVNRYPYSDPLSIL